MTNVVLDSSAVLAMVYNEPGGKKVRSAIVSALHSVSISAVNWCEVLTKLGQKSPIMTAEKLAAVLPGVEVVPFGRAEAEHTSKLAKSCGSLSLGDRACVALAKDIDAVAWTGDRIWKQFKLDVAVDLIRP
jgi:PIN domain nuclease of toxin-antitoxin system